MNDKFTNKYEALDLLYMDGVEDAFLRVLLNNIFWGKEQYLIGMLPTTRACLKTLQRQIETNEHPRPEMGEKVIALYEDVIKFTEELQ